MGKGVLASVGVCMCACVWVCVSPACMFVHPVLRDQKRASYSRELKLQAIVKHHEDGGN